MTKEILAKLQNAKTEAEIKQIIKDSNVILTDEQLEGVLGGMSLGMPPCTLMGKLNEDLDRNTP